MPAPTRSETGQLREGFGVPEKPCVLSGTELRHRGLGTASSLPTWHPWHLAHGVPQGRASLPQASAQYSQTTESCQEVLPPPEFYFLINAAPFGNRLFPRRAPSRPPTQGSLSHVHSGSLTLFPAPPACSALQSCCPWAQAFPGAQCGSGGGVHSAECGTCMRSSGPWKVPPAGLS